MFGLVDYAIAGRLAFSLSGTKNLTTALGASDEARAAFMDITGGSGGSVIIPPVSKWYFVRNAAAGDSIVSAGGLPSYTFKAGDILPVFSDGAAVYSLSLGGKSLRAFILDGDQAIIDYINLVISSGSVQLPPATVPDVGKALMVRLIGAPPTPAWVPSSIQTTDVVGLDAALTASAENAVAFALTL